MFGNIVLDADGGVKIKLRQRVSFDNKTKNHKQSKKNSRKNEEGESFFIYKFPISHEIYCITSPISLEDSV